jgi:predicted AAA+ superfamily ATPase
MYNAIIMINRKAYIEKLKKFREKGVIKVITGIRRCGKSTLLELFCKELLREGVSPERIIKFNFEDMDNAHLRNHEALYREIKGRLAPQEMNYIFLDEVQNVDKYEVVADSLYIRKNVDLYITGSNAHFLSSELATLLSGRYVEIEMFPLTFKEYASAFDSSPRLDLLFDSFMEYGGFPHAANLQGAGADVVMGYLDGIFNTVVFKDVVQRSNIAEQAKLRSVIEFMCDNIGNITSPRRIAGTMTAAGRKVSNHTVESYLTALANSYFLYPVGRYDIKGKKLLETLGKYYVVDLGFRRLLSSRPTGADLGRMLENIVYFELLSRGNKVWVGKLPTGEIDFVIRNMNGELSYCQVAYTAREESTLERELAPLRAIKDHNPKYLLTMDVETLNFDGIKKINVIDFLLREETVLI